MYSSLSSPFFPAGGADQSASQRKHLIPDAFPQQCQTVLMLHYILAAADHIGPGGRLGIPGAVRPQQAAVRQVIQPHRHRGGAQINSRSQSMPARGERKALFRALGAYTAARQFRHKNSAVPFHPILTGQNAFSLSVPGDLSTALAAFAGTAAGSGERNAAPAQHLQQRFPRCGL